MDNEPKRKSKGLFSFLSANMCVGDSCANSASSKKPEQKSNKSWFGIIAAVIVIALMIYNAVMDNKVQKQRASEIDQAQAETIKEDLKREDYAAIEYVALLKAADEYKGKKITISGEFLEEIALEEEGKENSYLFVAIENDRSIEAMFFASSKENLDLSSGDRLKLYGEYLGRKEFSGPGKEDMNLPWLKIEYFEQD